MKKIFLGLFLPISLIANVTKVIVSSGVDLVIKPSKYSDSFRSSNNPVASFTESNGVLMVKARNSFLSRHAKVELDLASPLTYIEVQGDSNVMLDHAKTKKLSVISSGNGAISLKGNIKLAKIDKTGAGIIRGIWINADDLKINSQYGQIELAGRCNSMHLYGDKDSVINTQYLRCDNVWVRAKDYTSISILPAKHMKVWATDNSQVFYRKTVDYLNRNTDSFDHALVMHVSK